MKFNLNRCTRCVMPDTRPDVPFVDGVCQACLNHAARPLIDWNARRRELVDLLTRHRSQRASQSTGWQAEFDCIVPSSGGKDSHAQVLQLIELGARPLVVTATTCHLTEVGRANIDNLARYATTIEVTPNRTLRATLNRLGLKLVGDISWPEHVSIFTTPFKIAAAMGIPLVFYGENPQSLYGGPPGSEEARTMTRRWVSEFGGFLGMRPADLIGTAGITARDMEDYQPPGLDQLARVEAHFLGQYLPWDAHANARMAASFGMQGWTGPIATPPCSANLWPMENLDNAQTGLHDHLMFRKYGYGRGCMQASIDVRNGRMDRATALAFVEAEDGLFPMTYAGVGVLEVLDRIELDWIHAVGIFDSFTNWALFPGPRDDRRFPR